MFSSVISYHLMKNEKGPQSADRVTRRSQLNDRKGSNSVVWSDWVLARAFCSQAESLGVAQMRSKQIVGCDAADSARARRAVRRLTLNYRKDLKDARISEVKAAGCSQAAKWQPLSSLL